MMIHCLLVGTFVNLIGISYPQTAIIRDGKFVAVYSELAIAIYCATSNLKICDLNFCDVQLASYLVTLTACCIRKLHIRNFVISE